MNEKPHNPSIDPQLEARIVALVLGEASDFECDELNRLIEERSELAAFKEQVRNVHGLLRDVGTGESVAEDEDWKLPTEKRNELLAVFSGEAQRATAQQVVGTLTRKPRLSMSKFMWTLTKVAAVFCVIGLFGSAMFFRQLNTQTASRLSLVVLDDSAGRARTLMGREKNHAFGPISNDSATSSAIDGYFETVEPESDKRKDFGEESESALGAIRSALQPDLAGLADETRVSGADWGKLKKNNVASKSPTDQQLGDNVEPSTPRLSAQFGREAVESTRSGVSPDSGTQLFGGVKLNVEQRGEDRKSSELSSPQVWDNEVDGDRLADKPNAKPYRFLSEQKGEAVQSADLAFEQEAAREAQQFAESAPVRFADDPPIVYPDPEEWSRLSKSRWGASRETADLSGTVDGGAFDQDSAGGYGGYGGAGAMGSMGGGMMGGAYGRSGEAGGGGMGGAPAGGGMGGDYGAGEQAFGNRYRKGLESGQPQSGTEQAAQLGLDFDRIDTPANNANGGVPARGWGFSADAHNAPSKSNEDIGGNGIVAVEKFSAEVARPEMLNFYTVPAQDSPVSSDKSPEAKQPQDSRRYSHAEQLALPSLSDGSQEIEQAKDSLGKISRLYKHIDAGAELLDESLWVDKGFVPNITTFSKASPGTTATDNGRTSDRRYMLLDLAERAQKKITPSYARFEPSTSRRTAPASLQEKLATDEAFSTFSLHVSDVSFKLARAALAQGTLPDAAKIRIEEFVNSFDYGDPLPSESEKVACCLEQAIHPFLQQRNLLRVSMRTAAAGRSSDTPLRLTFLLDNSGSMERADRQQTVRRAFALLAQQLKPIDQVTLISFARQPRLLADKVSGAQSNQLVRLIDNLPSEGGTNIEAAVQLAFEKAREQKIDAAQNRIILLTDGAVNLGDANPDSLSRMIATMRGAGIAFDAAGISADGLNDEVLEALTRKGDGRYYLLDSAESADDGFAQQIAGALRPSAKNVKVQVEFNPKRVGRYKLLGFEKHRLSQQDFRNDKVDAAEMAAAEAGVAMYQFEARPEGEGDVGSVSVRFRDLSTGQMIEKRWPIPYEADARRPDQASPSIRVATSAALLAAKLRGEPLGESVELKTLSDFIAGLPDRDRNVSRVQELQQMIQQAQQIGIQ